jgi:HEAT repeat protein
MKLVAWVLVAVAVPASGAAQAAPARQDAASVLGRGWTALGARQPARALELAQDVLRASPASHDGLSLAIAALTAGNQPIPALDAYETWLAAARHEDPFLLRPVAMTLLRQLAASREPRVRIGALAALADAGDADARSQLQQVIADQAVPPGVDADLAAAGDQPAIARLEAQLGPSGARDKSAAIDALARANARSSTPALVAALKDPAPPSRMAAASALAELEATEAIPALKAALQDPDPSVRHMVGVALARLGDESGGVTMQSLAESPIGELRLIAARVAARDNPQGPWTDTVQRLLKDPDPLLRLKAARVLLESGRQLDAASAALAAALGDETPAIRTEAARLLRDLGQRQPAAADPAHLRRLLRDRLPDIQIEAARGLLALTR